MKEYLPVIVWAVVIGGLFAFLWWKGHLRRLSMYVQETREELKKCTWPSKEELKGATVLVLVSTLLLGAFIMVADYVLVAVVRIVTKA